MRGDRTATEGLKLVTVGGTARELVSTIRENHISFYAASFAYYAFVSILPMLLLLFVVVSTLRGEELARAVIQQVATLTPTGRGLIRNALTSSSGRLEVSIISLLTLLWSAVKVFRSLDFAFSLIYDATTEPTFLDQLRDGGVVLVTMAVAFVLMVVVNIPTELFSIPVPVDEFLSQLELFAGLVLAFFPMYYILPPVSLSIREALPGTFVAAGGWLVLQVGFQLYAGVATQYTTYGILGAVLLFVIWLYIAGIVLLVGACVNVVLSG
ncbi:YihY/virulence factor BrkB family protein [Haladaptatus sp. NG-SE-30]